jgi:hypothetical protein
VILMPILTLPHAARTAQERDGRAEDPPSQPLPFSHRKHAAAGLKCGFCHPMAGTGERAGLPESATCVGCHSQGRTDGLGLDALAEYDREGLAVPWKRVYALPPYVFFSHRRHVAAGARCSDCHGAVEHRDLLRKEGDISMAACVDCHLARSAPIDCMFCHTVTR